MTKSDMLIDLNRNNRTTSSPFVNERCQTLKEPKTINRKQKDLNNEKPGQSSSQLSISSSKNHDTTRDIYGRPPNRDVNLVVNKAKRAAASLWMVLHAQTCRLSGNNCRHQGCIETKRLLLHVKTCTASSDYDCPQKYHGCLQAKKLLAHYRRCREMRLRQSRQNLEKRGVRYQQHPCLVCTLVARHARNVIEGGKAPVPSIPTAPKTVLRGVMTTRTACQECVDSGNEIDKKSKLSQLMPPPPPRSPHTSGSDISLLEAASSLSALSSSKADYMCYTDEKEIVYGSPPTQTQLMQSNVEEVAKATAPTSYVGSSDSSMLGKSVDSIKSYMDHSVSQNSGGGSPVSMPPKRYFRRRAESFDERKMPSRSALGNQTINDPTLETVLRGESNYLSNCEEEIHETSVARSLVSMNRSNSCGILSNLVHSGKCDTILE